MNTFRGTSQWIRHMTAIILPRTVTWFADSPHGLYVLGVRRHCERGNRPLPDRVEVAAIERN